MDTIKLAQASRLLCVTRYELDKLASARGLWVSSAMPVLDLPKLVEVFPDNAALKGLSQAGPEPRWESRRALGRLLPIMDGRITRTSQLMVMLSLGEYARKDIGRGQLLFNVEQVLNPGSWATEEEWDARTKRLTLAKHKLELAQSITKLLEEWEQLLEEKRLAVNRALGIQSNEAFYARYLKIKSTVDQAPWNHPTVKRLLK